MSVVKWFIRPAGVVCACAATLVALGGGSPVSATPTDGQEPPSCVYTLSKPFVVDVSGVKMVSATLSSLPCTGAITPNQQTVCVQVEGGSGAPHCDYRAGYNDAQVYLPYVPGATYTSTGTGCGAVSPTLVSACATQGPLSATL